MPQQTTAHWDAPFRFDSTGKPVVNNENSIKDVCACVYNAVICPQGAKLGDPQFGIPSPLFQTLPLNVQAILTAVSRIEPRAAVTATTRQGLARELIETVVSALLPDPGLFPNIDILLGDAEYDQTIDDVGAFTVDMTVATGS